MKVVIVGGSAAGLVSALLLARGGHETVILEQDRLEPAADVESAAVASVRPAAPQILLGHFFMARSRALLRDRLPDVFEMMLAAGVIEVPLSDLMFDSLSDRSRWPGDEQLTPLMTRRSTFDWVLQKAVFTEPGLAVMHKTRVLGLVADPGEPPRVRGVRTEVGEVSADLVIDACGRRTPVDRWLREIDAAPSATASEECGVTYFGRQFRIRSGVTALPGPRNLRFVSSFDEFSIGVFAGDHGVVQFTVSTLTGDRRFSRLKEPSVFEAVLRTVPAIERWLQVLEPVSPLVQMTASPNVLRRLVVDGQPVVTGLHEVGDSLCMTNPTFGRGVTLAVWAACDLADVVQKYGDAPTEQALAMDQCITDHIAPYYEEQVRADTARLAALRHTIYGAPAPSVLPGEEGKITFTQLRLAASYDPIAFRALFRLMFMVALPSEIYNDPEVTSAVQETLRSRGLESLPSLGHIDPLVTPPTQEQLLAALAVD